jgi:hypothetical protein
VSTGRSEQLLRLAALLALVGLGLVAWSVLDPRPAPVLLGLTVGQAFGVLSFLLFAGVVAADLGLQRRLRREGVREHAGDSDRPPPAL